METLLDQVKIDYILLSMMTNVVGIGAAIISNIFDNINETCARAICLTVFFFILANMVHFSIVCITRLASIFLVGIIEDTRGKIPFRLKF
jgi:hypothetical protein